jgi:type VI protein secretion system component VasK
MDRTNVFYILLALIFFVFMAVNHMSIHSNAERLQSQLERSDAIDSLLQQADLNLQKQVSALYDAYPVPDSVLNKYIGK